MYPQNDVCKTTTGKSTSVSHMDKMASTCTENDIFSWPTRLFLIKTKNTLWNAITLCCGTTSIGNSIILMIYRKLCSKTTLQSIQKRSTSCATDQKIRNTAWTYTTLILLRDQNESGKWWKQGYTPPAKESVYHLVPALLHPDHFITQAGGDSNYKNLAASFSFSSSNLISPSSFISSH